MTRRTKAARTAADVMDAVDDALIEFARRAAVLIRIGTPIDWTLAANRLAEELTAALGGVRDVVSKAGPAAELYASLGGFDLATRVRMYVRQAVAQLRQLDPNAGLHGATSTIGTSLRYPMLRIAVSEANNATRENAISRAVKSRDQRAMQWATTSNAPCAICVSYAESDQYGLGAGVWPLIALPDPPHPFCACRLTPVAMNEDFEQVSARIAVPAGLSGPEAAAVRTRVRQAMRASLASQRTIQSLVAAAAAAQAA